MTPPASESWWHNDMKGLEVGGVRSNIENRDGKVGRVGMV